jgi:carboxyl-terminal processing protease
MRILKALGILILLLFTLTVGFFAGVMFDRQAILPVTGLPAPLGGAPAQGSAEEVDTSLIEEAVRVIQRHYADRQTLEETNLTYSAISGMVDALGDTGHSRFMSPEVVAAENRQIQGEFEGIGALLNVNEAGNPVILAPMDGSPAQKAGLRPGDIILEVNGEDVSQSPLNEVVRRVLGPAGTDVTLTVRSPDNNQVRQVTITRARIVVRNVTWQMLPGTDVAHVRIAAYSNNITDDLINALDAAREQGARGILLDLRNNPGGLLNEAIGVVSQFLEEGSVMQTKNAQGKVTDIPVKGRGVMTDLPVVVLINQGSASAAEITAGALQDYGRATLVGQQTFGTGTVLNQFRLSDGSALLLATELWLTPKGRAIWHQGIAPDVVVELPPEVAPSIPENERNLTAEGLKNLEDTQLLKGLEVLQEKIEPVAR